MTDLRTKSRKWYKDNGFEVETVERSSRFIRYDFLGFGDLMAWKRDCQVELCQVTSWHHRADHLAKLKALNQSKLELWQECCNGLLVFHFWKKRTVGKSIRWELKIEYVPI